MLSVNHWASLGSFFGYPMNLLIFESWSMSVAPVNKGVCSNSSPRIVPSDHISTFSEYLLQPYKISGALYHLVPTSREYWMP